MGFLVRAIAPGWFVLGALLAACGGGGGEDGSQPPPASSSPSTTVTVAPSGGSVALESKVVAEFSNDALVSPGAVTASLVPSTDSRAASARDLHLSIPSNLLSTRPNATITFTLFADAASRQAGKQGGPDVRAHAIDPATVWARVEMGAEGAVSIALPVAYDAATGAFTVALRSEQWTSTMLRWAATRINEGKPAVVGEVINFSARLVTEVVGDDANVPREIYWWTEGDAPQPSPLLGSVPVKPGRLPLLLVHGIDGMPFGACGGSGAFTSTWLKFAQRFFDDTELRSKYDLYTFAYPTTQGIRENGRQLARKISQHFGNRPVVVLSHSMGGLVTRFADSYYSKKGLAERGSSPEADSYDIDIHGVITLNTPHLGVYVSDDLALLAHLSCFDSLRGASDLDWKSPTLKELNGTYPPTEVDVTILPLEHLKRYVAYGGSFGLTGTADELARLAFGGAMLGTLLPAVQAACLVPPVTHLRYCLLRFGQLYGQQALPLSEQSGGDGVTLVKSQLLQVPDANEGWKTPKNVFAKFEFFDDTDHTDIHDLPRVLAKVRDDLIWIYSPIAAPPNGSFAGNTNIGVSAFNAERIYCTLRTTLDGSLPEDPPEPTEKL